jgi:hypothetical protein
MLDIIGNIGLFCLGYLLADLMWTKIKLMETELKEKQDAE